MMGRDLRSELEDFDGEYPPAWKPEPGEILIAKVLAYDTGHTRFGPVRTALLVNTETGERLTLWLSNTVLLRAFEELQPQPGEVIGIKHLGMDPARGYRRYKMRVDRPDSFSPLGGEVADQEQTPAPAPAPAAVGRPARGFTCPNCKRIVDWRLPTVPKCGHCQCVMVPVDRPAVPAGGAENGYAGGYW